MRTTRDLAAGMRHAVNGQRWIAGHRRLWALGMLPALLALVGYVLVLVAVAVWGGDLVSWATPFADGWGAPWRDALRGVLTVLLFGGVLLLCAVSFTAVTLLVGEPFYEAISDRVERAEGDEPPDGGQPWWREAWTGIREGAALLLLLAAVGLPLFALGLVPVLGQTVVPVVGACVSGFFLTHELTNVALQRRRIPLRGRLALLRDRPGLALGFGVPLALLFLVPLAAVVAMPGAVAGATLLARELVAGADPDRDPDPEAPAPPADPKVNPW